MFLLNMVLQPLLVLLSVKHSTTGIDRIPLCGSKKQFLYFRRNFCGIHPDDHLTGTTGEVLKRVSGTSVQDNKFVIVRGLNERYNTSLA